MTNGEGIYGKTVDHMSRMALEHLRAIRLQYSLPCPLRKTNNNTVLSRKAVGKKCVDGASDNPERYCG